METPTTPMNAERLVLKFRHALNIRHEHSILASMITLNFAMEFIGTYLPVTPEVKKLEAEFNKLEQMMNAHLERELNEIQNNAATNV
jgi:hypothetical protein